LGPSKKNNTGLQYDRKPEMETGKKRKKWGEKKQWGSLAPGP